MKIILALAAALLVPLIGQEAKIMIVEKPDSQRLSRAYEKYKQAQAEWEDTKAQVARFYTMEKGGVKKGWEKVQFSADFRAIVPESSPYATAYACGLTGDAITGRTTWATPASGTILGHPPDGLVTIGAVPVIENLTVTEKKP